MVCALHKPRKLKRMPGNLELDVHDLLSALRSTPALRGKEVLDPSETIITGSQMYRLVNNGLVLHVQDYHMLRPSRYRLMRRDFVSFQFTQLGGYRLHGDGQVKQVRAGSVRLNAMAMSISEFRQPTRMKAVSIFVERACLIDSFGLRPHLWREEHRAAFSKQAPSSASIEMPLTPEMWAAVDALINCNFDEPVRSVYLSAKTTELLALAVVQFNRLAHPGAERGLSQAAREQQLIEAAAFIYRRELAQPPSIDTLSRRIGLNRNKLTDGFRSAFGTTPAEYSRQIRLDWAARRLSEGLDVGQAAVEIGYDSTAAFGRAFRQQFGRVPSETSLAPSP